MPRLIDADELLKQYPFNQDTSRRTDDFEYGINTAIDSAVMAIEDAPTVEAVPVRHGHWIYHPMSRMTECSYCHRWFHDVFDADNADRFCRSCGAKMDEVSCDAETD